MGLNKKTYMICVVLTLLLPSLYLLIHGSLAEAQAGSTTPLPGVYVKWVQYPPDVNAVTFNQTFYTAVCGKGDYLYLAGYNSLAPTFSLIEVRRKSDGALVASWWGNGTGWIGSCTIVGNTLYLAGDDLLIFDIPLVFRRKITTVGVVWGIVSDGRYLYLAGPSVTEGGDAQWRIEKRKLDGTLDKVLELNPSSGHDYAANPGINPVTGDLWVVGYKDEQNPAWWIELIDRNTMNRLRYIEPKISGYAGKVTFDESGYAYVIGDDFVVKFDQNGKEVTRYYTGQKARLWVHIAYLNRQVYVVTWDELYVFDTSLNLKKKMALPKKIYIHRCRGAWGNLLIDGGSLYFTGFVNISSPRVATTSVYSVGVISAVVVRGRDGRVWVSLDGGSSYTSLGGGTPDGPSAVLYGDKLFVAVRGSTNSIYYGYVNLFDGKFSGWMLGPGSTVSKPALAAGPDGVFIAVRGGDNGIYIGKIREDGSFTGWSKLPGTTIDAPSIAYLNGRVHLVVRGGSNTIWHGVVEVLPNGTLRFTGWTRLPGTTSLTPDLALDPGGSGLYLAVTGGDGAVYLNYYSETKGWHGWIRVGGRTDTAPAVAVVGGAPLIVVKGYDSTAIYYTIRNPDGTWAPWTTITGSTDRQPEIATAG